jgi:hypothetical protein
MTNQEKCNSIIHLLNAKNHQGKHISDIFIGPTDDKKRLDFFKDRWENCYEYEKKYDGLEMDVYILVGNPVTGFTYIQYDQFMNEENLSLNL